MNPTTRRTSNQTQTQAYTGLTLLILQQTQDRLAALQTRLAAKK